MVIGDSADLVAGEAGYRFCYGHRRRNTDAENSRRQLDPPCGGSKGSRAVCRKPVLDVDHVDARPVRLENMKGIRAGAGDDVAIGSAPENDRIGSTRAVEDIAGAPAEVGGVIRAAAGEAAAAVAIAEERRRCVRPFEGDRTRGAGGIKKDLARIVRDVPTGRIVRRFVNPEEYRIGGRVAVED